MKRERCFLVPKMKCVQRKCHEMLRNVTKCHEMSQKGINVFDYKNEVYETKMSRNVTKMLQKSQVNYYCTEFLISVINSS